MALPLVLLAAGMAYADGVDSGFHLNGSDPPPAPACGSLLTSADGMGNVDASCSLTTNGTTLGLAILDANVIPNGDLSCTSQLTNIGWTLAESINPGGVDTCSLTAPSTVSLKTYVYLLLHGDPYLGGPTPATFVNDGDCDLDDFVLGIPAGCDFNIMTTTTGPVVPNSLVSYTINGAPFQSLPEPSSGLLLLAGLGVAIPFLRRKVTV
jgi:hypothetical protein